jgi:hypothetical protein
MKSAEPRWPAVVAMLAVGILFYAMPEALTVGPRWLLTVTVTMLSVPLVLSHRASRARLNEIFGYISLAVITLAVIS